MIEQIKYKAYELGISVIVREESYTSKASALDNDMIPNHGDKVIPQFSGRRVKRGLYKSKQGILNADVNGALNILRKETGDALDVRRNERALPTTVLPVLPSYQNHFRNRW